MIPLQNAMRAEWAEAYVRDFGLGLVLIPAGKKGPREPGWNKNPVRDPKQALEIWGRHPDGNMGALLGASRLLSFDVDAPEFAKKALEATGFDFDAIMREGVAVEGNPVRGKRLYRAPEGEALHVHKLHWPPNPNTPADKNGKRKHPMILELRSGDGVQDVLPPSSHPETQRPYRFLPGRDPWSVGGFPEAPAELLRLWRMWPKIEAALRAACPWTQKKHERPASEKEQRETARTATSGRRWDEIRREILRRLPLRSVLSKFGVVVPDRGKFSCPLHPPDKNPSAWLWTAADGVDRMFCAHGANGISVGRQTRNGLLMLDAIDFEAWRRDLTRGKTTAELAHELGIELQERTRKKKCVWLPIEETGEVFPGVPNAVVLGEVDGVILLYDIEFGQIHRVERLRDLDEPTLARFFGPPAARALAKNEDGGGGIRVGDIRVRIAVQARQRTLSFRSMFGQGIWPLDECRYLVVCGSHLLTWDGKTMMRLESPVVGNRIALPNDALAWADIEALRKTVSEISQAKAARTFDTVLAILKGWWFRFTGEDAALLTGLVFATAIQHCWAWRPLVSLTGRKESGKTALLSFLSDLFGTLALLRDGKMSEAGLRQEVGHDGLVVLLDEFERNKHRQEILQLLRTCGKGGEISRGGRDHRPVRFGLRHIVWTGGIDSGLAHSADHSRFLVVELEEVPKEKRGTLELPSTREISNLSCELFAAALWAAPRAVPLARTLSSTPIDGLSGRMIENLAVPFATIATLKGLGSDEAAALLKDYGREYETAEAEIAPERDDCERLVTDLLCAAVRVAEEVPSGDRVATTYHNYAVGQLIEAKEYDRDLEALGVKLHEDRIFLYPPALKKLLGEDWHGVDIGRVLGRFAGAEAGRDRISGRQVRGMFVLKSVLLSSAPTECDSPPVTVSVTPQEAEPHQVPIACDTVTPVTPVTKG